MPQPTEPIQYQCRHIKPDGGRCGSPALRKQHFCYYHGSARRCGPRQPQVQTLAARKSSTFDLPSPADLAEHTGVGLALGLILHKIAHNEIDPRRAGLLLYGLQIASINLKRHSGQKSADLLPVEDVAFDPDHGPLAPQAELGRNEPKGRIELLVEQLEREEELRKEQEQAEWDERQRAFEQEKQQREAWKREDALRSNLPGTNPQGAVPSLSPQTTPPGAKVLPVLQARTETHTGPCRGRLPQPQGNRADRRRLRQRLARNAQGTPHARQAPPEVQT